MVTARSTGKNARWILCPRLLSVGVAVGSLRVLAIAADPPSPPKIGRVEPPNWGERLKNGPLLFGARELQVYSAQ